MWRRSQQRPFSSAPSAIKQGVVKVLRREILRNKPTGLLLFKGFTTSYGTQALDSFMSVLYNLAKWLFLYSVYFSSLSFFIFFIFFSFFNFFLWTTGSFFSSRICFFCFAALFFPSVHTQLFTIELFTMVLITCELIYIPIC